VLDVGTHRLDALTPGSAFDELQPAWSPDGRRLAFARTPGWGWDPGGRSEICVMQAEPGARVDTLLRLASPNSQHLEWTADGGGIVYLEGLAPKLNAYIQDHPARVSVADGSSRALGRPVDRAVTSFALAGDALIATLEDDGSVYPVRLNLAGGAPSRIGPAGGYVTSSVSSRGGHTAALQTTDTQLAEVVAVEDGRLRRLTHHNDAWLADVDFGAVEDIGFKSRDGTEVHALLIKPVDFSPGHRYPTVLWIHGGPNGQDQHELVLDGYQFEHQWLAGLGYAVLRVNYRGGSGRGAAFAEAIAADWGHHEVEDLLAGVDALVSRGVADPKRLAIGGWSYGGILTDYAIASDARFKAAVSGAGSANQLSMYGADQYILQYENELGSPWRATAKWLALSYPFFHADRIHTPTLFLGGEKDFNVPVAGGEQMYEALKVLGVPAQLVVYPDQHHVFSRPSFIVDLAERVTGWYEKYLPTGSAPPAAAQTVP
jgi:dipeptidyl aminopeptidase/acylaminoacyl peptidase